MTAPSLHSTSYVPVALLGSIQPRLATPPLRELTPETSYGFDVIDFARDVLGTPLDPWEEVAVIRGGELLPDRRPRFRYLLIIVARQNGKTLLSRVLTLYWMFVEKVPLVLGIANKLGYAKVSWSSVIKTAQRNPWLKSEVGPIRLTIGEECFTTTDECEYRIAAANADAGRSLTVHRLVIDELRSHKDFQCWNAATNAMNAVPYGQAVAITNQGDYNSVVLDSLRDSAIEFINTGIGDPRLGLLEWSAPEGSNPTDVRALAMANPNLGHRVDLDALVGAGTRAKAAGGLELTGFLTEVLCIRVNQLDSAIDLIAWINCAATTPIDLADHRDKVALCLDVALDGSHATLTAAAVVDGLIHVEVIKAWDGWGCTKAVRADLPGVVREVKPRALGWFPNGPAAAVAADLADRGHRDWPPRRVKVEEIRGEVTAVCMGYAEVVTALELRHPDDALLNQHVNSSGRQWRGDAWVFLRGRGSSPIDATYSAAGAVHLARTLPPPPPALVAL
jgi:hypothetical protein